MSGQSQEPYVVKRYANRKLYDTVLRRFTTLDAIAKLLEQGTQVVVRDHTTGADRTDEVLGQVLGRRVSRTPGGSDLLAGLLRAPAQLAMDVAGTLGEAGGVAKPRAADELDDDEPDDGPDLDDERPAKPKSEKSGKKGKSGKKKSKKADGADGDKEDLLRRQQAEISELRGQISQLTEAVTLLLKEKTAELEAEQDGED